MYRMGNRLARGPQWAVVAVLIIGFLLGCSGETGREAAVNNEPMILFAVDGLEWQVMSPLLAEGKLPVLAGLMGRGSFGYLDSMTPTFSAVIWTSIATGKVPEKHGIRHFVFQTTRKGKPEYHYYTSGHRETEAFWNILGDYGLGVHCIGWWMTYPAEPINGVMVSQTNTTSVLHDAQRALWKGTLLKGVSDQVHPLDYQNRVMDLLDEVDRSMVPLTEGIFGRRPNPSTEFSQLMWDQTQWAFRADATYLRVAKDILESGEPFDLMAIYIGGPDVAGHRFWRYAYPGQFEHPPSSEQIRNYGELINDYYVYVDRALGEILGAAPANSTVIIVSDHGMHAINTDRVFDPADPPQFTNSGHHLDEPPGVFIAAGERILQSASSSAHTSPETLVDGLKTVGSVLDVVPTLFALKGIPLGKDFDGTVMRDVIEPNWLAETPVRYVKTHDSKEWLASRETRIREAIAQSERLDQLRSLGYIR